MPEYVFVDGPLAGQSLGSSDPLVAGELLAVEVVDVGQGLGGVPMFEYVVDVEADEDEPGVLRHTRPEVRPVRDPVRPSTAA